MALSPVLGTLNLVTKSAAAISPHSVTISRFRLDEHIPNTNGSTTIVEWYINHTKIWTPVLGKCILEGIEKFSRHYAGKACIENGYLGGWEVMVTLIGETNEDTTPITWLICDPKDDYGECIARKTQCEVIDSVGAVRCFNATRARRSICNSGYNSSTPVSILEVYSGNEWVQLCRSDSYFNTTSLCRALGLEAHPIMGDCRTDRTESRFHGCSTSPVCDECTVKCSVPHNSTCPEPCIPENGFLRNTSGPFPFGARVEYVCNSGYHLQGIGKLECVVKNQNECCSWSNETPLCVPITGNQTNGGSISIAVIVVIVSGVTVMLAVLIIIIIFFKKKYGSRNRKQTHTQSIIHTYFDNRSFNPDTVRHEDDQENPDTVGLEDDPENSASQSISHTYFDNRSFNPHAVGQEDDPENLDTVEYEDPDEDEPEYEDVGSSEWEIAWEDLNLSGKILGKGNFGDVQLAQVKIRGKWIKAAVKTLKDGTPESERALFKDEFDTMTKIGYHPNVVNILGSCEHAGSFYVVLEYVHHGNLRKYLRKCRKEANKTSQRGQRSTSDLSPEQLLHFAIGVSKAMMHIADCGIIHRDLAARNILVARGFTPKVSDFGMSREENVYTQVSSRRVPTRWLAIESLTKKMYSTQSDVWSFGILLWEIATFGGTPYSGMETRRLARHLRAGYRMPKPENCDDDMYQLMLQCWQEDPNARPTFKDIVTILSNMAEQDKIYMSTHVYENYKYAAIRLDRDDR